MVLPDGQTNGYVNWRAVYEMTSLREELQNYIEEELWITNDSLPYHTDEILNLIEKRIDEYVKTREWNDDDAIEHWFLDIIKDIKEMLK